MPEKSSAAPWVLPLDMQRVCTREKGHEVGIDQFIECVAENPSVVKDKLCVVTGDSCYFTPRNQEKVEAKDNLILISRMKSNRKVYARYQGEGHKKYDKRMKLNDPASHIVPDQTVTYSFENRVAEGFSPSAPTPPIVRIRNGRFKRYE